MKSRVAVQAFYEYDRRGFLPLGQKKSCDFFCEVSPAWPEDRERLYELLFAACAAELRVLCEQVNAGELFPETHRVAL